MELNSVLHNNKGLYVIAEVTARQDNRAISFSQLLLAGSYEIAVKLSRQCKNKSEDIIIIPPFTRQENNSISPEATASFFRAYYG